MGEVHYMISEAAKRVNVETHVLRYWEEELLLTIGRTEMGHRYYTEEDELKEQGMILKDLKSLIPDILRAKAQRKRQQNENVKPDDIVQEKETISPQTPKLENLQEALLENNKILENSISLAVSQAVIREMDFLLQAKERQEEERYKKLDQLIRQQQTNRKENAKHNAFRSLKRVLEA